MESRDLHQILLSSSSSLRSFSFNNSRYHFISLFVLTVSPCGVPCPNLGTAVETERHRGRNPQISDLYYHVPVRLQKDRPGRRSVPLEWMHRNLWKSYFILSERNVCKIGNEMFGRAYVEDLFNFNKQNVIIFFHKNIIEFLKREKGIKYES